MLKTFIERPVLSTVISIIIVILGVLGLSELPVTQYPDIAPPTVQVNANYPGANAETILESVIVPIEEQINGVEGMTYITSSASNNGSASITVFFEQGYDPDIAAVNVQNRVSRANAVLPDEVIRAGVITTKRQNSALLYAGLYSTNPDYDDTFIQNYLNINVKPELQRINGVGEVNVFGGKDYAMRVWLDPAKMANYGLVPRDVTSAIGEQSLEAASGALGQNAGESFEYVLKYKGRYKTAEEYENIIITAQDNGQFLRVKDVGTVELDAFSYSSLSRSKGHPAISFGVFQTAGSNAQEIIEKIHEKMDQLEKDFPTGLKVLVNFDTNEFLNASIKKVVITIFEAFALVFLVVFIFLQDFRSTLIPAIAVPVSIIGTFFFLNLFGYSINLLTLFALVLAIGIVVDDAIVVVEAVHAKLDEGAKDVKKATLTAMNEISGAIISITLVMAAVFIPVTFIQGPTGVFYEQFGITLIVAIIISAINALTLSPALCALLLKPYKEEHKGESKGFVQRFFDAFNAGFKVTTQRYSNSVQFLYRHKWMTVVILVLALVGIWWSSGTVKTGFVPDEDRGIVFLNVELPPGSSIDRTHAVNKELYTKLIKIPGVLEGSVVEGRSFLGGNGSNYGLGFIRLQDWDERDADSLSIERITAKMFEVAAGIPEANIIFFSPPSIPGFSSSAGVEVNLLDNTSGSFIDLDNTNQDFMAKLNQRPEIQYTQSSFSTAYPQYELELNVPRAKELGVSVSSIFSTLQGYIGSVFAADFSRFWKQYRVYVQALPEDRADVKNLDQIYVRTDTGEMTPITEFIALTRVYGPQSVTRFNLFNSTKITAAMNPGFSSGDVISAVEEVSQSLPVNYSIAYSGLTREEVNAGSQTTTIFLLSLLFVYFLLAAQYESYLIPFAVLSSLPLGVFGAYISTQFAGLQNNIYFQIALIMLVGLLAKNAILIVEFALQRRREGFSIIDAAVQGAEARLRPILMTSFAFILGLMPLVLASGVGAEGNRSIGTGAVGGLLIGTVTGVFVIPILFVFFQWLQEKISGAPDTEKFETISE